VGFLALSDVAISRPSANVETVSGRIVAYAPEFYRCWNGKANWAMLIRVQEAANIPSRFIEVQFSLSCKKSPKWLYRKPPVEKFRLKRDQHAYLVLDEFCPLPPHGNTPCWIRVPSAEHEEIPFGHLVPNYDSLEHPPLELLPPDRSWAGPDPDPKTSP